MNAASAGFMSSLSNARHSSGASSLHDTTPTQTHKHVEDLVEPEEEQEQLEEAEEEKEEEEEEQLPVRRSSRSTGATPSGTPAKGDHSSPAVASSKRTPRSRFRQFWHAAEDFPKDVGQALSAGLDHARLHPKFLHTNATSHKWALGAFAELLDNAIDEVPRGATYVSVDVQKQPGNSRQMLVFEDDGFGMTPESLRSCMSFGYSKKLQGKFIGQYGNGFKTGTIRLGADALVFTRCESDGQVTESCGLLSYTFLRETGQDDVVVPIVDWVGEGVTNDLQPMLRGGHRTEWDDKLETIMQWSPFKEQAAFFAQFERIREVGHGTTILVYNLWETEEGDLELDLTTDVKDIRSRVAKAEVTEQKQGNSRVLQDDPYDRWKFSLKAYAGILYLRRPNNFKIYLRGHEVPHTPIQEQIKHIGVAKYSPRGHAQDGHPCPPVEINIGFSPYAPKTSVMGFCVYNKNRLIKPFWKVYSSASSTGRGVVGILEANFIEPAHDKQDFEKSYTLSRLEVRLKKLVTDYWRENAGKVGYWSANVAGYHAEMSKRKKAAKVKAEESDDVVDEAVDDEDEAPPRKVKVEGRDAANKRARPAKRRSQASDVVTDSDDGEECEDEGEVEVKRSPVALQQQYSQLSKEKSSLQTRVEELEKQVARLQQERKAALQTASQFQRACEEAQLAHKQVDAKLRRLSTTTSMLQTELESAQKASTNNEETSRLSTENEELKLQLEAFKKKQADLMSMLVG
eukprot:jgi/Chlat1/107/Chrsp1S03086